MFPLQQKKPYLIIALDIKSKKLLLVLIISTFMPNAGKKVILEQMLYIQYLIKFQKGKNTL